MKIRIPKFDDGTFPLTDQEIERDRKEWNEFKKLRKKQGPVSRPTKPINFPGTEKDYQEYRSRSIQRAINPQTDTDMVNVLRKREKLKQSHNVLDDVRNVQDKIDIGQSVHNLSNDINAAIDQLEKNRLENIKTYKTYALNALRAAELMSSGATLLGMYSRFRKWGNSANASKKYVYNLLSKNQLPLTYANTGIDLAQTGLSYPDVSKKDLLELGGDAVQIVGASDVFRNTKLYGTYGPYIDNLSDGIGGLTAAGDIGSALWDFGNNIYTYINSLNK